MCSLMNSGSFSSSQLLAPYSNKAAHEVTRPARCRGRRWRPEAGRGRAAAGCGHARSSGRERRLRRKAEEVGAASGGGTGGRAKRWERRAVIGIGLNLSECVWVKTSKYIWSLLYYEKPRHKAKQLESCY
jgi:hypothetical protein